MQSTLRILHVVNKIINYKRALGNRPWQYSICRGDFDGEMTISLAKIDGQSSKDKRADIVLKLKYTVQMGKMAN